MTDEQIKALAEAHANTIDWKLGSEFYTSYQMWERAKESFEAGYQAALGGIEVKEVWEAVSVEDELPRSNNYYFCLNPNSVPWPNEPEVLRFDTYNSTWFNENGDTEHPSHWLKKTTVRVVKENINQS